MKTAIAALAVLFATGPAARAETPAQPQKTPSFKLTCPAEVRTAEHAEPADDWTVAPGTQRARKFSQLAIFDGNPSANASLVPDIAQAPPKPSTWNIDTPSHENQGYWVGCSYKGTTSTLVRKLPEAVKKCTSFHVPDTGVVCN